MDHKINQNLKKNPRRQRAIVLKFSENRRMKSTGIGSKKANINIKTTAYPQC